MDFNPLEKLPLIDKRKLSNTFYLLKKRWKDIRNLPCSILIAQEIGRICNTYNAIDIDYTVLLTHIGREEDKKLAEMLDPAWGSRCDYRRTFSYFYR